MLALVPSSAAWLAAALADLPVVLVDHAHCEKKAAAMALRHAGRHADWPRLAGRMSRLAREELVHFERVLAELARRGLAFRGQPGAGYAAALLAPGVLRAPSPTPRGAPGSTLGDRTVDEMLVCALIEARSHERLELLAGHAPDAELRTLYQDLCDAEARHGDIYVGLALEAAGDVPGAAEAVAARAAKLCAHEAQVLARPGMPVRMHAGG